MTPRIAKPEKGNKYYINVNDGGWSKVKGNPRTLNKYLTSLPNCLSAYGWFNEIGGQGMKYLKTPWYPYTVINAAKKEGLTVLGANEMPVPGGIMVWTGGSTGEGHVEGCAKTYADGSLLGVGSEYYGKDWTTFRRYKGSDGNWRKGCSWMTNDESWIYRGCIVNPFMEEDMTKEETTALINEMVPKIVKDMEAQRSKLPADGWAEPHIQWAKENGIMNAEDRPQDAVKREEATGISRSIIIALAEKLYELAGVKEE